MVKYNPKDLSAIYQELIADNDRAKAIVGGAFIDAVLAGAISRRLRKLTKQEGRDMFTDAAGPFATCHAKIQAAYALDICGPKTKSDLVSINKIRNEFAHNMNKVSFDDPEIADRCRELASGASGEAHAKGDWRAKFVQAIEFLTHDLLIKERHEQLLD